jgi:hypothetical protein
LILDDFGILGTCTSGSYSRKSCDVMWCGKTWGFKMLVANVQMSTRISKPRLINSGIPWQIVLLCVNLLLK